MKPFPIIGSMKDDTKTVRQRREKAISLLSPQFPKTIAVRKQSPLSLLQIIASHHTNYEAVVLVICSVFLHLSTCTLCCKRLQCRLLCNVYSTSISGINQSSRTYQFSGGVFNERCLTFAVCCLECVAVWYIRLFAEKRNCSL